MTAILVWVMRCLIVVVLPGRVGQQKPLPKLYMTRARPVQPPRETKRKSGRTVRYRSGLDKCLVWLSWVSFVHIVTRYRVLSKRIMAGNPSPKFVFLCRQQQCQGAATTLAVCQSRPGLMTLFCYLLS